MAPTPPPLAATQGPAIYFDGLVAARREVTLRLAESLEIGGDGAAPLLWRYDEIRRADGGPGVLRLASIGAAELARLDIADEALKAAIEQRCAQLGRRGVEGAGKIVFWSLAAVVSLVLIVLYGVPLAAERLVPLVPASLERRLGDAVANQVDALYGDKTCTAAPGKVALDALVGKLAAQAGLPGPIPVTVLDTPEANAFALPGGRVFVLRGLIEKAASVDELAGVLAHELGHVAHRDGLREMISSGGSAFLLGLLLGDVTGSGAIILAGKALVQSAQSRDAEANADAFAAATLRGLGRSPAPLGEFLLRLTGKQNAGPIAMLASHPLTQDRLAALKKDDAPNDGPDLADAGQWRAIGDVCGPTKP